MNVILTYRGRTVTDADVDFLRKLIADHPAMHRKALSQEVCRAWDWRQSARGKNRHLLAYNSRFLIPPWVQVPHLASHVLGRMARLLPVDWQRIYGHPVCFLETFVDPTRHRGTCYRAANWIVLGQTFGRGHRQPTKTPNRPVKLMLALPLVKSFRELLGGGGTQLVPEAGHEIESGNHRAG